MFKMFKNLFQSDSQPARRSATFNAEMAEVNRICEEANRVCQKADMENRKAARVLRELKNAEKRLDRELEQIKKSIYW